MYLEGIPDNILAKWIVLQHFERFQSATLAEIAESYIGIYSTRPTSWLAILARNQEINGKNLIFMETDPDLIRIPGMRRSKFLLPKHLASKVFSATRLPVANHEWRLREVKLTLADYRRVLPDLTEFTKKSPKKLQDIKKFLEMNGPQARACTTVATYEGKMIRTAPSNHWSNRWMYMACPSDFLQGDDSLSNCDELKLDIANRYIENYGPVSTEDLAWWMSISKKKARSLLERTDAVEIETGVWISVNKIEDFENFISNDSKLPPKKVRFLPAWDPLAMGYAPKSRQRECLGINEIGGYDSSGNGRPVVLIGSRAVTTWNIKGSGSKRSLSLDYSNVPRKVGAVLKESALDLANKIGIKYESLI